MQIVRGSLADSQHELFTLQGESEFSVHLYYSEDIVREKTFAIQLQTSSFCRLVILPYEVLICTICVETFVVSSEIVKLKDFLSKLSYIYTVSGVVKFQCLILLLQHLKGKRHKHFRKL